FERHRMIWSGAAGVEDPCVPAGLRRSLGDDGGEACLGECAGAGAGDQETAGGQLLEGEAVEVAVLLQRGVDLALAAGPLRRVEHDHVVAAGTGLAQELEGVAVFEAQTPVPATGR